LRDALTAIFLPNVFDYVRASVVGEVDVDVGRVDALRIQEAFKE